jgi:hypothetical protein
METTPHSKVHQFSSYVFDIYIGEILFTLTAGATIYMPSDRAQIDDLTGVLNDLRITSAILIPGVMATLEPVSGRCRNGSMLAERWGKVVSSRAEYSAAKSVATHYGCHSVLHLTKQYTRISKL